jgi:hypothetical protein
MTKPLLLHFDANTNRPMLLRFRKGLRSKAQKAANATHDGNLTAWLNDLIEKTTNKLPS